MLSEFSSAKLGRYQSIKRVSAGKIVDIAHYDDAPRGIRSLVIEASDGERMGFDPTKQPGIFARYTPVVGDRLVVYEDGYASISPAAAFESGYLPEAVPAAAPPSSGTGQLNTEHPAAADVGSGL